MQYVNFGTTGLQISRLGFGGIPIQRIDQPGTRELLIAAHKAGINYIDTARAYTVSEAWIGQSLEEAGLRDDFILATKCRALTKADMEAEIATSLKNLRTDHIELFQFHNPSLDGLKTILAPGGAMEALLEAKARGIVGHIGITAHKIGVAEDIIASGLYETLQYPFSYLSTPREAALAESCRKANMGLIAMKALAGGLVTNADAAFAYIAQYDNVLPIWGIQRPEELEQWLGFFRTPASLTPELRSFIEKERGELTGEFCRGCGYCLPCPAGIQINQCARISLMIRRAPSESWLAPAMQAEMEKIEHCLGCGQCKSRCPYELDTPNLLKRNLADYRRILAGEVSTESYLRPAQK